MSSKYNSSYKVSGTHEISIDHNGCNYLVIYGHHINGGFIAVPNWGISSEAGSPEDIFYNTEKLSERFDDPETAKAIAEAVCEHWESVKSAAPAADKAAQETQGRSPSGRFTARRCDFNGMPGYMVKDSYGETVEQFVSEEYFPKFCEFIGEKPKIINAAHVPTGSHEREER